MPRATPDVSRVGRILRLVGRIFFALGVFAALLDTYLYVVAVYPQAVLRAHLVRDLRDVAGAILCMVTAAALSSRREWGRRLARNGALVASLFGLKTLADGVNGHIGANAVITTLAWLAGVAYVCFLLSRPDVTAQFGIDTDELDKPLTRRLACPILVVVGVLLIATSNVDMRK